MRRIAYWILLILFVFSMKGQSTIEKELSAPDLLFEKIALYVGEFKGDEGRFIKVAAVKAKAIESNSVWYFALVSLPDKNMQSVQIIIPYEELKIVCNKLSYIEKKIFEWKIQPRPYTEVYFYTKNKLKIGFYQVKKDQKGLIVLENPVNPAYIYFKGDKIPMIRSLFEAARKKLEELGAK